MDKNYNNPNSKLTIRYRKSLNYGQVITIAIVCSAIGVITTKVCDAIEKRKLAKMNVRTEDIETTEEK